MTTAFQPNAFQGNAFQESAGSLFPPVHVDTTFQPNAFQSDCFQIYGAFVAFGVVEPPVSLGGNRWSGDDAMARYLQMLEEDTDEEYQEMAEAIEILMMADAL